MKRVLVLLALAALLVPAALAAGPAPTLRMVDAKPMTLRGEHFRGGERVFVVLRTTRPYGRSVTTRADGSFTAVFTAASLHCGRTNASARGASGDHAVLATRRMLCTSESIHPPLVPIGR